MKDFAWTSWKAIQKIQQARDQVSLDFKFILICCFIYSKVKYLWNYHHPLSAIITLDETLKTIYLDFDWQSIPRFPLSSRLRIACIVPRPYTYLWFHTIDPVTVFTFKSARWRFQFEAPPSNDHVQKRVEVIMRALRRCSERSSQQARLEESCKIDSKVSPIDQGIKESRSRCMILTIGS